jgi:AcrR family transcriptional regulator
MPKTSDRSAPAKAPSGTEERATRRRGQALEDALLAAAWEELQQGGYAALTMERVAERAGTSRAVIYRRWRNRPELVIAAMRHHQPVAAGSTPDTGSLRGDVVAVMRKAASRSSAIGSDIVVGLLADLLGDEDSYAAIGSQLLRGGTEVMRSILERAAERGEARADVPDRVARLPLELLRQELILTHRPPGKKAIEEIVDQVFLPLVLA